jgi:hypothetical protein
MFNALSKCTPRFLTKGASLTTQPSNCNWQFLKSLSRCLGANTISSVLSSFNFYMFDFIQIDGDALLWIKSYLHGRSQRVAIGPVKSNSMELKYGVPQGSVLGPKMYCIFSKPIGAICSRHDLCYHCYANEE